MVKSAVDAADPTGEIAPMALAKALKTMMLVTKKEALTERGVFASTITILMTIDNPVYS